MNKALAKLTGSQKFMDEISRELCCLCLDRSVSRLHVVSESLLIEQEDDLFTSKYDSINSILLAKNENDEFLGV